MRSPFCLALLSFILIFPSYGCATDYPPASASKAMVVSDHALASKVGIEILQAGGNAMDAAVAMGYALAVVQPCCGNLGGGGFMLIHWAGDSKKKAQEVFLNFREKAPLAATQSMYATEDHAKGDHTKEDHAKEDHSKSQIGYLAVGVPGTVLGLETAYKKYGQLSRDKVMAPAIQLAEEGYPLRIGDIIFLNRLTERFKTESNIQSIFTNQGKPYQVSDILKQLGLANTLKLISQEGSDVFYKGSIANKIVEASQAKGGILDLKDFETYTVEESSPLRCTYRNHIILTAPPPSSGGIALCEMLNILEGFPLSKLGYHSVESSIYLIKAMRQAFRDRNQLGDPKFVQNPTAKLISKKYAGELRQSLQPKKTKKLQHREGSNTTHYSVIDEKGNIVAVTYTLNSLFGAEVIAGDTGFFLNNEMDDFTTEVGVPNQFGLVQGAQNAIEPQKTPLSSMSPTIVMKGNRPLLVLGAAGGPRIITTNLQTLINVVDYGFNIREAVNAPRFHHQYLPDVVQMEQGAFTVEVAQKLRDLGYDLQEKENVSVEEALMIEHKSGMIYGASDPRRAGGLAVGY